MEEIRLKELDRKNLFLVLETNKRKLENDYRIERLKRSKFDDDDRKKNRRIVNRHSADYSRRQKKLEIDFLREITEFDEKLLCLYRQHCNPRQPIPRGPNTFSELLSSVSCPGDAGLQKDVYFNKERWDFSRDVLDIVLYNVLLDDLNTKVDVMHISQRRRMLIQSRYDKVCKKQVFRGLNFPLAYGDRYECAILLMIFYQAHLRLLKAYCNRSFDVDQKRRLLFRTIAICEAMLHDVPSDCVSERIKLFGHFISEPFLECKRVLTDLLSFGSGTVDLKSKIIDLQHENRRIREERDYILDQINGLKIKPFNFDKIELPSVSSSVVEGYLEDLGDLSVVEELDFEPITVREAYVQNNASVVDDVVLVRASCVDASDLYLVDAGAVIVDKP